MHRRNKDCPSPLFPLTAGLALPGPAVPKPLVFTVLGCRGSTGLSLGILALQGCEYPRDIPELAGSSPPLPGFSRISGHKPAAPVLTPQPWLCSAPALQHHGEQSISALPWSQCRVTPAGADTQSCAEQLPTDSAPQLCVPGAAQTPAAQEQSPLLSRLGCLAYN